MNNWEKQIEIDGMKFTVKCYNDTDLNDTAYFYRFAAYNKDDKPVANTAYVIERKLTDEEFEKEVAEPCLKRLQVFIVRNYVSTEFMTLLASKIHEHAEKNAKEKSESLKKRWQTFIADEIRKAADSGKFAVNIVHNDTMSGDTVFDGGYDRDLMLVDTPKILEERGFKVKYFEDTNGSDPTAFTMTISW